MFCPRLSGKSSFNSYLFEDQKLMETAEIIMLWQKEGKPF